MIKDKHGKLDPALLVLMEKVISRVNELSGKKTALGLLVFDETSHEYMTNVDNIMLGQAAQRLGESLLARTVNDIPIVLVDDKNKLNS